jgi:hypothetical protein
MNGPFRRRRGSYLARTTDIAAENLGPGDRTLQRIHYLNISEFIRDEAWWFAACSLAASGSHFRDPHLMNNPTKMPTGNIRASHASSSSLPIVQLSNQLMPQFSQ